MTYGYIRVSIDKQDGANQKLGIEDLCKRKGLFIQQKKQNPQVDTSEHEEKIDDLIYKLYGLTSDKIKIVEGK